MIDDIENMKIKNIIYSLDLKSIQTRLAKQGWSSTETAAACKLYMDYLFLRWKYPEINFPPSKDIDAVWKEHILHSDDYRNFCKKVFYHCEDHYLDHYDQDRQDLKIQFDNITQKLYFKEFGKTISKIRGKNPFEKIAFIFKKMGVEFVSAIFIGTILTIGYTIVSSHNNSVNSRYFSLENKIRDTTYDEEDTFNICKSDIKEKHPNFYIQTLYDLHKQRRNDFTTLVNLALSLRTDKLITEKAYNRLKIFTRRTNTLYELALDVCAANLLNPEQIEINRNELVQAMEKSKNEFLWRF